MQAFPRVYFVTEISPVLTCKSKPRSLEQCPCEQARGWACHRRLHPWSNCSAGMNNLFSHLLRLFGEGYVFVPRHGKTKKK
jgi:hypothetical protein